MMAVKESKLSRYQLRYAAGQYWLLDMEQAGVPYKRPMSMNATGATIWNMLKKGQSAEAIALHLSEEYEMNINEIREDILQFQKQLAAYGVTIEE